MKIRKRQAAADILTRDAALPISWKYQKPREWPTAAAAPAGLQVQQQQQQQGRGGLESSGHNISDGRKSSNPSNNEETVAMEVTSEGQQQQANVTSQFNSDRKHDHVVEEEEEEEGEEEGATSGSLMEESIDIDTDTHRALKRHRKHETNSDSSFQGAPTMTATELLVVHELANGVRQRLRATEGLHESQSAEQVTTTSGKPAAEKLKENAKENAKDALISSIFFVFDTCGENGLSASDVVKTMLEQGYPGLKEGGARHTVQVANVLRSSSSFVSLGDKRYLMCSSLEKRPESNKPQGRQSQRVQPLSAGLSEWKKVEIERDPAVHHHHAGKHYQQGKGHIKSSSNSTTTTHVKPARDHPSIPRSPVDQTGLNGSKSENEDGSSDRPVDRVVIKIRRRGPLTSQRGQGPTQCKRYDGRGWQCSRLTEPGYSLCVHHQDLINKRAAKLKEAQTVSRISTSVEKVVKTKAISGHGVVGDHSEVVNQKPPSSSSRECVPGAPVQKRKLLSLLAIC